MATGYSRRRINWRKNWPRLLQYLILALVTLIILVPTLLVIFAGLKTRGEFLACSYTPPTKSVGVGFRSTPTLLVSWGG